MRTALHRRLQIRINIFYERRGDSNHKMTAAYQEGRMQMRSIEPERAKRSRATHYFFDKIFPILLTALIIGVIIFLFQNNIEQSNLRDQQRTAKQEKVAGAISDYSETIIRMSLNLGEINRPLSDEYLQKDYEQAQGAIKDLIIQRELNKRAFEPYSKEIDDCIETVEGYCSFIRQVQQGTFQSNGTLHEYSIALHEHHRLIQEACTRLSNHCSNVVYGFER